MNAMELLDIIGGIRGEYIMEAQRHREHKAVRRRRSPLKVLLVAAAMAALLAGCAYAVLRLQDLKAEEPFSYFHLDEPTDHISMQGYAGSDSYMAAKEWNDYLKSYDQEQILFNDEEYARIQALDGYGNYLCYTQEMMDKLDEICEKYNMNLIGKQDLWPAGIQKILKDPSSAVTAHVPGAVYGSFFYEDGSFEVTGDLSLPEEIWPADLHFGYLCLMKCTLNDSFMDVGDIEAYDQWAYTTKSGVPVMLAVSHDKALIIADQPDCFVTVNLMNPTQGEAVYGQSEQTMDRGAMEAFAEAFDLSFRVNPEEEKQNQPVMEPRAPFDPKDYDTFNQPNYAAFVKCYLRSVLSPFANEMPSEPYYTFYDINHDGVEELIIFRDGKIEWIAVERNGVVERIEWMYTKELCEGDVLIELQWIPEMNEKSYSIYRLEGEKHNLLHAMRNEGSGWKNSASNSADLGAPMTEQEVMDIVNSYQRTDLSTLNPRPLKELASN